MRDSSSFIVLSSYNADKASNQDTSCTSVALLPLPVIVPERTTDLSAPSNKNTKVLYLEGYLWDLEAAKNALTTSAIACRNNGGKVALSLSDPFCVERHRESFVDLVNNNIDILFANESEIISLYQAENFEEAVKKVKDRCEITALTIGEKGSIVLTEKETMAKRRIERILFRTFLNCKRIY